MPLAFMFITVKAGTDEAVVEKLKLMEGVDEVLEIYGAYDILAKVRVGDEKALKDVEDAVKGLEQVKAVERLTIVKEWKRPAA